MAVTPRVTVAGDLGGRAIRKAPRLEFGVGLGTIFSEFSLADASTLNQVLAAIGAKFNVTGDVHEHRIAEERHVAPLEVDDGRVIVGSRDWKVEHGGREDPGSDGDAAADFDAALELEVHHRNNRLPLDHLRSCIL